MLEAIGQSFPIAVSFVFVAAPMIILAVLLVIKRPPKVTGAFLAGWMLGLAVVGGIVIVIEDLVTLASEPAWWASGIKIALGIALIVLAIRKWRARPRGDDEPTVPKWMAAADTITAGKAFVAALLLASVNPKHLVIMIAGATVIADATARVHEQVIALAVFIVVASLGVAAPAIISLVLGDRSGLVLAATDRWMTANNAVIMAVVLLVLGAILIGNGVTAL